MIPPLSELVLSAAGLVGVCAAFGIGVHVAGGVASSAFSSASGIAAGIRACSAGPDPAQWVPPIGVRHDEPDEPDEPAIVDLDLLPEDADGASLLADGPPMLERVRRRPS